MAVRSVCLAVVFIGLSNLVYKAESAVPCRQVACFADPCQFAACPAFSRGAVQCRPNFCGGCKATWMKDGLDVTETCRQVGQSASANNPTTGDVIKPVVEPPVAQFPAPQILDKPTQVASGQPPCQQTRCFMDPCAVSSCPAYPGQAVCSPNQCGGCHAKWMMNGVDVTLTCGKSVLAQRSRSPKLSRPPFRGLPSLVPNPEDVTALKGSNPQDFGAGQGSSVSTGSFQPQKNVFPTTNIQVQPPSPTKLAVSPADLKTFAGPTFNQGPNASPPPFGPLPTSVLVEEEPSGLKESNPQDFFGQNPGFLGQAQGNTQSQLLRQASLFPSRVLMPTSSQQGSNSQDFTGMGYPPYYQQVMNLLASRRTFG